MLSWSLNLHLERESLPFNIDLFTGEIRVVDIVDREAKSKYKLNVTVCDRGAPRRCAWKQLKVYVDDENDNRPEFGELAPLNVSEAAEVGTELLTLRAHDADIGKNSALRYSLLNHRKHFHVQGKKTV